MEKFKHFIFKLFNCGYDEPVFENYREELLIQNGRMVRTTSFIGSIMMIILTISSLFVSSVSKVRNLYFIIAIVFLIIYLCSRFAVNTRGKLAILNNYAFLTAAFAFAIGLDIIQKNDTATTICVLLVALPLLVVDRPYQEFAFFGIVTLVFMYETTYIKQSPKASIDVLNAISFFAIGTFLGYKHNQMVLRNMRGHRMLETQRDTDTLTSLYTKGALETKAVEFLKTEDAKASLIVIDMDNFKYVNDTYGHHSGDEILTAIGKLLHSLFRNTDLISRFGGDEFIVFLPMADDKDIITEKVNQILNGVKKIRITADPDYRAHICLGISRCPYDGTSYDELFKNADSAMYKVKREGKNGFKFYDEGDKKQILLVDDIETNRAVLKAALDEQFAVFEASDGIGALKILSNNPEMSLVITDIQMPNMDGIALVKQIRANHAFDDIAIIANTQHGDLKLEELTAGLGVDDFIYKAASPTAICKRVYNVLKVKEKD